MLYLIRIYIFTIVLVPFKIFAQERSKLIPPFYRVGAQIEYNYFISHQLVIGANIIGPLKKQPRLFLSYDASVSNIFIKNNYEIGAKLGTGLTYDSKLIVSPNIKVAVEYYINGDFRFGSEIGIALFRLININYGFYPSINNRDKNYISNHRLTITVKINPIFKNILAGHMAP